MSSRSKESLQLAMTPKLMNDPPFTFLFLFNMRTLEIIKTTSAWKAGYKNLDATTDLGMAIYNVLLPYNKKETLDGTQSYIYVLEWFSNDYKSPRPVEKAICLNNADDAKILPLVEEVIKKEKNKLNKEKMVSAIQAGDSIIYKGQKVLVVEKGCLSGKGQLENGEIISLTLVPKYIEFNG